MKKEMKKNLEKKLEEAQKKDQIIQETKRQAAALAKKKAELIA